MDRPDLHPGDAGPGCVPAPSVPGRPGRAAAGIQITAWYWDIESGALDLADRSQGDAWRQVAEKVGIPRDGGVAELLADASGPAPKFAAATWEEIERVARDTLASLTVEKELAKRGIPIFAADEPASLEGASPTTILVRRVRQGVADYYRLQMLGKCWNGLIQHAIDGWNIGTPPYGYAAERHPHPAGIKAAQKRTRTRLVPDPDHGPVVTRIFDWRVNRRLSVPTIAWKLNGDPDAYPPPGGAPGWAESTVSAILRNPKYTGYMVFGRTRKDPVTGKPRPVPASGWTWSPEPTHEPLTPLATWQAAQTTGAERGNVRDTEKPTAQPGSRYMLRSRIRYQACQHRMYGVRRPSSSKTAPAVYTYYHCPYNPSNPRHAAAHPDHLARSASIREETIVAAITAFLDTHVFSPGRADLLAQAIPAADAEQAETRTRTEARLRGELDRIRAEQKGLMRELARTAADTSPATQAYREDIQAQHAELHAENTAAQAQLDQLTATTEPSQDPALLDELPYLTSQLDDAPAHLVAALLDALDIQVLYRPEQSQATIWATLTDTTPGTITALFSDPRVTASVPSPRQPAETSTSSPISASARGPIRPTLPVIMELTSGADGTAGRARPECASSEVEGVSGRNRWRRRGRPRG